MTAAKLVVIQRGHYPRKTGATGTPGRDQDPTEQEFAVAAAAATARSLQAAGFAVRTINADVPTAQYGGWAFVAIHCDGSTAAAAHGASVGYQSSEGASFAAAWKAAYYKAGWRGFRSDNYTAALRGYYGVRHAVAMGNRRAIIVESGFLTNVSDERTLQARGPGMVAQAIVTALGGPPTAPRPPAPPVVGGGATLRRGSTGDQVRQWQTILAGAGHLPPGGIDGVFGTDTEVATKRFQEQLGIEADGVVGPDTRAATARMLAWVAAAAKNQPREPAYPGVVEHGDTGWAVKVWQRELVRRGYRLSVDGRFLDSTERAVVNWQRNHGLEPDGIAGPQTWHSLLRT